MAAGLADEYRAEMIARTEIGTAYNATALGVLPLRTASRSSRCSTATATTSARRGATSTVPIDDAPDPLGHPNCTRDILPVIEVTP